MAVIYEQMFRITTPETDRFARLRPAALLGLLQESAGGASVRLGIDRDRLMERDGVFWMLVRVWFRLERPIQVGEELTVRTWHRGNRGVMMYRDYDLFVGDEQVGEAVSVWLVASYETREMVNLSRLGELTDSTGGEFCKSVKLAKLRLPAEQLLDENRRMQNSDLDVNQHVNNTRYADFATDAIHCERLPEEQFVSEMQIGYLKECKAGEIISMYTAEKEGWYYVRGADGEGCARFDAKIGLKSCSPS